MVASTITAIVMEILDKVAQDSCRPLVQQKEKDFPSSRLIKLYAHREILSIATPINLIAQKQLSSNDGRCLALAS